MENPTATSTLTKLSKKKIVMRCAAVSLQRALLSATHPTQNETTATPKAHAAAVPRRVAHCSGTGARGFEDMALLLSRFD
jgi:hypothetical protein